MRTCPAEASYFATLRTPPAKLMASSPGFSLGPGISVGTFAGMTGCTSRAVATAPAAVDMDFVNVPPQRLRRFAFDYFALASAREEKPIECLLKSCPLRKNEKTSPVQGGALQSFTAANIHARWTG